MQITFVHFFRSFIIGGMFTFSSPERNPNTVNRCTIIDNCSTFYKIDQLAFVMNIVCFATTCCVRYSMVIWFMVEVVGFVGTKTTNALDENCKSVIKGI